MIWVASYIVVDYWRTHYKITNRIDGGSCSKALTINDATTIQAGNEELVLITPTTPENKKKVEKA